MSVGVHILIVSLTVLYFDSCRALISSYCSAILVSLVFALYFEIVVGTAWNWPSSPVYKIIFAARTAIDGS